MRRCRHGPAAPSTSSHRSSSASGSSPTTSFPPAVTRNHRNAEVALRPWTPSFTHGDLQVAHVFVDGDEVTGILDWSEAAQDDPLYDLAILTLGHQERLDDVVAGYGRDVDLGVIRAWWSIKGLLAVRWLAEHGFELSPEIAVLRAQP